MSDTAISSRFLLRTPGSRHAEIYLDNTTDICSIIQMDLTRPFGVVTPTVDGDVLAVLARADSSFTAPAVHRLIGDHSEEGVRRSLQRLHQQGIVRAERAGQAYLYQLNRDHLAAEAIIEIAHTGDRLRQRISTIVSTWAVPPDFVALFGSAATGSMSLDSDIDVLVIRPDSVDVESETWRAQIANFEKAVTAMTGNDTRVLELRESEVEAGLRGRTKQVLADIRDHGIVLAGPTNYLRRP
jgi:predicted nucleotidyltransferase